MERPTRTAWALAGSSASPNSARSPPLQNDAPRPADRHGLDRLIGHRDVQGRQQPVAHRGVERVVDLRSVQLDLQRRSGPGHGDRIGPRIGWRRLGGGPHRKPPSELGTGLEHRVHEGLGDDRVVQRKTRSHAEELDKCERGER